MDLSSRNVSAFGAGFSQENGSSEDRIVTRES